MPLLPRASACDCDTPSLLSTDDNVPELSETARPIVLTYSICLLRSSSAAASRDWNRAHLVVAAGGAAATQRGMLQRGLGTYTPGRGEVLPIRCRGDGDRMNPSLPGRLAQAGDNILASVKHCLTLDQAP